MRRARILALVLLVLAAWPGRADAHPVSTENLTSGPIRPGWAGGFDASFALARGNIDLLDVGGAGRIYFQTLHQGHSNRQQPFLRQRVLLAVNGRFATQAGDPYVSQGFSHLRWTAMWHRRVGHELFAQYQFNEFLRLNERAVGGGGVRVAMVNHALFMLWGATGYMIEHERIAVAPGAPDSPRSIAHRWTSYVVARLSVAEGALRMQSTTYVQPRFDDPGDLRLLEEFEAMARVSEVFSIGATLSVLYDSRPPSEVEPLDLRLGSTVRLSF
ncbi:DUF481 domain-containing protein [Nannocystaceae bacterium ST9]